MENNYPTEPAANGHGGKSVSSVSVTKPKTTKAVAARAKSQAKARAQTPRSPRAKSAEGKLVCRYCGSDDLAPSFKKRRDARCRVCFKKRYSSIGSYTEPKPLREPVYIEEPSDGKEHSGIATATARGRRLRSHVEVGRGKECTRRT